MSEPGTTPSQPASTSPKQEFWEEDTSQSIAVRRRRKVTIKSILILTTVFAAAAVCLGQYIRAVFSDAPNAMGQFGVMNSLMPTAFLFFAFWFFKIFGRFLD